jgi:hypothetical protein
VETIAVLGRLTRYSDINFCLMNESETFTTVESVCDMNGPRIARAMIFQVPDSSPSE